MNRATPFAVGVVLTLLVNSVSLADTRDTSSSQGPHPLLTGADVSEKALLEALAPKVPGPSNDQTKSRQIEVRPKASLLITFETNSALLTAAGRTQLSVVAAAIKNVRLENYRFNIEGHADPRGTPHANQILSQKRAESVRDYLVNSHGIASNRLLPLGKGDSELMNPRSPAAPENRRVTIVTFQ